MRLVTAKDLPRRRNVNHPPTPPRLVGYDWDSSAGAGGVGCRLTQDTPATSTRRSVRWGSGGRRSGRPRNVGPGPQAAVLCLRRCFGASGGLQIPGTPACAGDDDIRAICTIIEGFVNNDYNSKIKGLGSRWQTGHCNILPQTKWLHMLEGKVRTFEE